MNTLKYFLLIGILLTGLSSIYALGGGDKDKKNGQEEDISSGEFRVVQVTGLVRLVGNEPFSEPVITGSYISNDQTNEKDVTWYIAREDRSKLRDLQYRTITAEGEEVIMEMTFASGASAGIRRTLRNIRIISVE